MNGRSPCSTLCHHRFYAVKPPAGSVVPKAAVLIYGRDRSAAAPAGYSARTIGQALGMTHTAVTARARAARTGQAGHAVRQDDPCLLVLPPGRCRPAGGSAAYRGAPGCTP